MLGGAIERDHGSGRARIRPGLGRRRGFLASRGDLYDWPVGRGGFSLEPETRSLQQVEQVTVALLAGSRLLAQTLGDALNQRSELSVVASENGFEELVARIGALDASPRVLVVEHDCVDPNAARAWCDQRASPIGVVVTSVTRDLASILTWTEAGAQGLLTGEADLDGLAAGILVVASGQAVSSPQVTAVLLEYVRAVRGAGTLPPDLRSPLTAREHEVARLVERGLPNKEIARTLDISVSTVKHHVHNILSKLELENRGSIRHGRPGSQA